MPLDVNSEERKRSIDRGQYANNMFPSIAIKTEQDMDQ